MVWCDVIIVTKHIHICHFKHFWIHFPIILNGGGSIFILALKNTSSNFSKRDNSSWSISRFPKRYTFTMFRSVFISLLDQFIHLCISDISDWWPCWMFYIIFSSLKGLHLFSLPFLTIYNNIYPWMYMKMTPITTITVISYRSRNKCKTFPIIIGSKKVPTL